MAENQADFAVRPRAPIYGGGFGGFDDCGGEWILGREAARWALWTACVGEVAASVTIPQELAWRVFTKGIDRSSAWSQIEIRGDRKLGERVLELIAIVA